MSLRDRLFRSPRTFLRVMRWYPPYLGAGIRVREVSDDFGEIVVDLRQTAYNRNAMGTHFGGSLYAMVDPFYVLMLIARLGPDYVVWDKAAQIEFLRPGKGTVTARFRLTEQQVDEVRAATAAGAKHEPLYRVEIRDREDRIVALVRKTLFVRRKDAPAPARPPQQ